MNNEGFNIQQEKDGKNLSEARKRLTAIQGPSISFKRPRQSASLNADKSLSTSGISYSKRDNTSISGNKPSKGASLASASKSAKKFNPISSPYGNCSNVSERFQKVARIGEGTYGVVYKAIDLRNQEVVALKRCLPHHQASDGFPITTLREIQILREICLDAAEAASGTDKRSSEVNHAERKNGGNKHQVHENIVYLKEVAVGSKSSSVFLVFEYVHFDLAKLIDDHYAKYSKSPFTLPEVKCLTNQLFSALRYLHKRCIIHRDLKLSNLLYNKDRGLLKLADFGLARKMDVGSINTQQITNTVDGARPNRRPCFPSSPEPILTPKVVSLWYRPPELLLNADSYTMAIDQWASGCVVAEMLLGKPLFRGKNDLDQFQKIVDVLGPPFVNDWPSLLEMPLVKNGSIELPLSSTINNEGGITSNLSGNGLLDIFSNLSTSGIEMLKLLLSYDPDRRWSAEEAFECSWLKEYPHPTKPVQMPKFENKL